MSVCTRVRGGCPITFRSVLPGRRRSVARRRAPYATLPRLDTVIRLYDYTIVLYYVHTIIRVYYTTSIRLYGYRILRSECRPLLYWFTAILLYYNTSTRVYSSTLARRAGSTGPHTMTCANGQRASSFGSSFRVQTTVEAPVCPWM